MTPALTEASRQALEGLRDFSTIKWYAVPLLAVIAYIYAREFKACKASGNRVPFSLPW